MTTDDVAPAERVTAIGFHELDTRMFRRSWPDPQLRPPERSAAWIRRTRHLVGTDPGGCWVAERDGDAVGRIAVVILAVGRGADALLPGILAARPGRGVIGTEGIAIEAVR